MKEESSLFIRNQCYLACNTQGDTQLVMQVVDLPLYKHTFISLDYHPAPPSTQPFHDAAFPLQFLLNHTP